MLESEMKELGIPPYKLKVEVDHENRIAEFDCFLAHTPDLAETLLVVIKEVLRASNVEDIRKDAIETVGFMAGLLKKDR